MKITTEQLKLFLTEANRNGYANKDVSKSESLRPKSEDYHFEQGDLIYHDTYFGARDFIGEEVVYEKGEPIWGANYYGFVLKNNVSEKDIYGFLRESLMQEIGDVIPVRGPKEYISAENIYKNEVVGDMDRFTGKEEIYFGNELVYQAWYHGGRLF
jgi:hypothetical protein